MFFSIVVISDLIRGQSIQLDKKNCKYLLKGCQKVNRMKKNPRTGNLNATIASQVDAQTCYKTLREDLKEPAACMLCKCDLTV